MIFERVEEAMWFGHSKLIKSLKMVLPFKRTDNLFVFKNLLFVLRKIQQGQF